VGWAAAEPFAFWASPKAALAALVGAAPAF
jgi:hypothetical protein